MVEVTLPVYVVVPELPVLDRLPLLIVEEAELLLSVKDETRAEEDVVMLEEALPVDGEAEDASVGVIVKVLVLPVLVMLDEEEEEALLSLV